MIGRKNNWVTKEIYELPISLIDGDRSKRYPKRSEFKEVGVPFLNAESISGGRLDISKVNYISEKKYNEITKGRVQKDDLILTMRGNGVGDVAFITGNIPKGLINAQMLILRPDGEVLNPKFLFYAFSNPIFQSVLANYVSGSAQPQLTITHLKTIPIAFPSIEKQKAIAHILGTIDDRIELNRKMNETLEAMAQALFKSWFVDFDPVIDNALANGKEVPEELAERAAVRAALGDKRKPLPADIRAMFPDAFILTDEMGWIPKRWEVASVSKFGKLNKKSWTKKNAPESVKYVDLANTKNGKINMVVSYSFADAPSRARRILSKDDTIIGTVRPGNRSFAYIHDAGLTGSTGFAVLSPKEQAYRSFIYTCLTRSEVIEHFAHLADGAAYPAIRPEVIADTLCVLPSKHLVGAFDDFVYPWLNKIGEHEKSSSCLSSIRDTLLPKLLSGELRIPDAEKMIEEAV